jgi:folylpolyglutamate synthase/dihydropteroate synthase
MDTMDTSIEPKTSINYSCNYCQYISCKKSNYERHILTHKHKKIHLEESCIQIFEQNEQKDDKKEFTCICGKIYKFSQGLSKHKKKCR